jgi:hypothetical protein
MQLQLLDRLIIDTRSWKVLEIKTWEANISLFVQEVTKGGKLVGILTQVLWFEDLSQCDELRPYTSVEVEIFDDRVLIERRDAE